MEQKLKDLNLLLLFLGGWEEDSRTEPGEKVFRSWKGFLFEALNELEEEKMIRQFTKSVVILPEGIKKAREIKNRFSQA